MNLQSPNQHFFNNNLIVHIFAFATAKIMTLVQIIILYLLCKHNKLRWVATSPMLLQVREVGTPPMKDDANNAHSSTSQFYIILALSPLIFGLKFFKILQARKIKLCRRQLFSNAVKILLFISDIQNYILIKLCKTVQCIHLFKITGILMPEKVKLKKHYIWVILEVDWKDVKVTFNGNVINLPRSVTIKIQDKFKVRYMMERQPLLFHLMLKQGSNWFTLASKDSQTETFKVKLYHYINGM